MGSIGQSAPSSLPVLDFQQQFSSQPFAKDTALRAFAPFGQQSLKIPCGLESQCQIPSAAGRKRSHNEAAANLEDDSYFPQPSTPLAESTEGRWENDERTTLISPSAFIADAGIQTGTWAEEKTEQSLPSASPDRLGRQMLRSRKSQRLDLSATPAIGEQKFSNGRMPSSSPARQSPTRRDPTVDDFTMHLGIGWSRVSSDEDVQAAVRGWTKYLGNHFQITDPKILLQSRGLSSYLVEAREGWFLFGEDLKQGRLVATSLERTFEHLRTSPPVFDGEDVLVAVVETVKAEVLHEAMVDTPHVYAGSMNRRKEYLNSTGATVNGVDGQISNGQAPTDEMDMS